MSIILSKKTIQKINEILEADQGATYRGFLGKVLPHMADAYREDESGPRTHLGASLIGGECTRALWYSFRWAKTEKFSGRIVRLFNRGHLEEGRFIALLLMIGCQVYQQDENGNQFRLKDAGGHFGGSLDGIITNCPDVPDEIALVEFKTHGEKSFKELQLKGVKVCKLEHFVQMQIYMGKMGLRFALYLAVNKNDDDLYGEIILFDENVFNFYIQRANNIIFSDVALEKISNTPGWYKCKFCTFNKICHYGDRMDINCRTCKHSIATENGTWVCGTTGEELDKQAQLNGCNIYDPIK